MSKTTKTLGHKSHETAIKTQAFFALGTETLKIAAEKCYEEFAAAAEAEAKALESQAKKLRDQKDRLFKDLVEAQKMFHRKAGKKEVRGFPLKSGKYRRGAKTPTPNYSEMVDLCTVKTTRVKANKIVDELIGPEIARTMVFSCYETTPNGDKYPDLASKDPVPNLAPKVILWTDYWRITDKPQGQAFVESQVLEAPTWADILPVVNAIIAQGDGAGIFFEGLRETNSVDPSGARRYEVVIGS
jgi:hypothetical protein